MIYIKAYTRLNLGDDLLIKILCEKYSDKEFCIMAPEEYKNVFSDLNNLKILSDEYNKLQAIKNDYTEYKKLYSVIFDSIRDKCDTFIYIGGSIFIESNSDTINRLIDLKEEISLFKNSYILGSNFGPYKSQQYYDYVRNEIIPCLNHITFRDIDSYNLFKDLDNVSYAPDIVFSLDINSISKKKELGISLINHLNRSALSDNYHKYLEEVANITKKYIKDGYKIRLLSFCTYEKDPEAIDDFMQLIDDKDKVSIDYYNGDITKYLNIISSLDTIIATRFHSIVLGLKYGCKVIPICYSNKAVNLLNDLGINSYVEFSNISDINNINPYVINDDKLNSIVVNSNKHFNNIKD